MVEEAGEDFKGDGVLQVGGRDAAGMRDDLVIIELQTERTARKTYRTRNEARAVVFDYIVRYFNTVRRYSTILRSVELERKVGLG